MPMYRNKPVEIEARQFMAPEHEELGIAQGVVIAQWCGGETVMDAVDGPCILIHTLEGTMKAKPGDWIIRGVNGEFYPCKPDIFAATYEAVEGAAKSPFNLADFRRRVLICRDNVLGRSARMPLGAYVAVSIEDFDGYESTLQPQYKFLTKKLNDAGIVHLLMDLAPVSPSSDLSPGQCEYRVVERESSHA